MWTNPHNTRVNRGFLAVRCLGVSERVYVIHKTIDLVREVVRGTSPRGFMHGVKLGLADGYSPEQVAAKVDIPVLMISGSEDRVNPTDRNAAILAKALPHARLEILEGVGHLPEVEAPDRINGMLRQFFAN